MPNLPQQAILPALPAGDNLATWRVWGQGLNAALARLLNQLTYVVNGLCRSGAEAEKADLPPLDETFYAGSDSGALWVAVNGAWVQVGPRRGSTAVAAAATTASVTLSPEATTTGFRVIMTPDWGTTAYVSGKAVGGFTCNFGTAAPGGGGTVDWMVMEG